MTDWPFKASTSTPSIVKLKASAPTLGLLWHGFAPLNLDCLAQGVVQGEARLEGDARESCFVEFGKAAHRCQNRVRRRLAEPTAAHPHNGVGKRLGRRDIRERCATGDNFLHPLLEQSSADPAWRTPAAGLVDEEMGELQRDLQDVAWRAEDHRRAAGREILVRDAPAEILGRNGLARRTAHLDIGSVRRSRQIEKFVDGYAERYFVD